MSLNHILKYNLSNSTLLNQITTNISKNITGRICHNKCKVLYILCELYNIKTYLEIGVHNGMSASYVAYHKKPKIIFGLDLFLGEENTMYNYTGPSNKDKINDMIRRDTSYKNIQLSNRSNSIINLIKGNSLSFDFKTLNTKFDLVFIDGDHTFEGVRSDFDKVCSVIHSGSIIVFDDYNYKFFPQIVDAVDQIVKDNSTLFKVIGHIFNNEFIIQKN